MSIANSPQTGVYTDQIQSGRNTTMHFDAAGVLDLTSGKVLLPGNLRSGHIDLGGHLFSARELASAETISSGTSAPTLFWGGLLSADTTPSLANLTTAIQSLRVQWVSANVDAIKLPPISLPADFSTAGGLTIQLYGENVGSGSATDAIQAIQIKCWMGVAGSDLGSTHPNFTSTPGWQGITIASGSVVPDVPVNITLVPQAHALRALNLYGARIRYTRTSS